MGRGRLLENRLFTVLYFSVRWSRSIEGFALRAAILPECQDNRTRGTFENQDGRH